MSGFTVIDLAQLPAPDLVEALDFEAIFSAMRADLIERDSGLAAALELESEPLTRLLQVCAYREMLLRQRVNDAARSVMLAFARAGDLDNLAAFFGVQRATGEDDDRLRRRVQLSLEGHSTAGPRGSYIFWGLSADGDVKDIAVHSPDRGEVVVTVLSEHGDGTPDQALLDTVADTLDRDDVRPLTDHVTVQAAEVIPYQLGATLTLYPGPQEEIVLDAARRAAQAYVVQHHKLGHDIAISGLHAALHQPGVQRVELSAPAATLEMEPHQVGYCSNLHHVDFDDSGEAEAFTDIVIGGRDE